MDRLRFVKRRSDWRLGRWTAKKAILCFFKLDHNLKDIEILPDKDGSPQTFILGEHAHFSLSISHSHSIAMCCLYPEGINLGCDIEFIENRSETFVADYFTEAELRMVKDCQPAEKNMVSNLIWSAKESALKTLREGLRLDTRSVSVFFEKIDFTSEWFPIKVQVNNAPELHGWGRIGERFVQTIACEQPTAKPVRIT